MKKEISVVGKLVFVKIIGQKGDLRKTEVTKVKGLADQLKAKLQPKSNENGEEYAELIYESDKAEAFAIMLKNMW